MAIDILSKFRGSGANAYVQLGHLLLNEGDLQQAAKAYSKVFLALAATSTGWNKDNSPEQEYIVNHQYKFIYCPIPKVACSSLKKVMVLLSDLPNREAITKLPNDQFHALVYHSLTLSSLFTETEATEFITQSQYFKFAFVRNPWIRLFSAYLNKFVQVPFHNGSYCLPGNSKEVIDSIYSNQGLRPNYQSSISFSQFVDYVSGASDQEVDGHWKSQHIFLGNHQFDFIGQLENISRDFSQIKKKLGISLPMPWDNRSSRSHKDETTVGLDTCFANALPEELRKIKDLPDYHSFYTPKIIDIVGNRYHEDISRFNYTYY
jgi:hypothetical protein